MSNTNLTDLRKKAKLPANQAGGSTVKDFFDLNKSTLAAVLPEHVTADRMNQIALGALRTTPKLKECTVESLFGAVVQCAQLGLEPNTPMGHAYLIPFRNNAQGRQDVQVIIGYRGLVDLARRSGQIVSIAAHEVCENDQFEFRYGLDETLDHIPALGDRGKVVRFYAAAKLKGGGHAFEVMSVEQVIAIRDASQNWQTAVRYNKQKNSPWEKHFVEMGRKTLIRRLFKYLPVSIEMARASDLDAKGSTGEAQNLDSVLEGEFDVVSPIDDYTDPDSPAADANGEVFDPEIHLAVDRLNADGSFTKRPKRGGKKTEAGGAGDDPVDEVVRQAINDMAQCSTMDDLDDARGSIAGPDVTFTKEQLDRINEAYARVSDSIAASEDSDKPGIDLE